jgi:hypothetical protein
LLDAFVWIIYHVCCMFYNNTRLNHDLLCLGLLRNRLRREQLL